MDREIIGMVWPAGPPGSDPPLSASLLDARQTGNELSGITFADSAARVSTSYVIDDALIRHLLPLLKK